ERHREHDGGYEQGGTPCEDARGREPVPSRRADHGCDPVAARAPEIDVLGSCPQVDAHQLVAPRSRSASWSTRSTTAETLRTPASVAGKGTTRYRSCRTAVSFAVAGLVLNRSFLRSAVFHAESTRTMTSGSAATTSSHPNGVQVSCTSAATLVSPTASMII